MPRIKHLWLQGNVRDYWGVWSPATIEAMEPLNNPECFRPSWHTAPPMDAQLIAARSYAEFTVSIPPGSFIYAILHQSGALFKYQITDVGLNHSWFNTPVSDTFTGGRPYYLPDFYPVVEPGNFRIGIWNPNTVEQRCEIILAVVEPRQP